MSRTVLIAALLAGAGLAATAAQAAEPAPVAAAHKPYTTTDTTIGELLDDPGAKEILMKHVPGLAGNAQIEMARGMSLKAIQGFAGDMLTDETLGKIDYDLAKLPPKH